MKKEILFLLLVLIIVSISCGETNPSNEREVYTQNQIDSIQIIKCDSLIKFYSEHNLDSIGKSDYQPKNFEECLAQLDTLMNDSMKKWIKCLPDREFSGIVHHSFGMYLRNNWGLWGDTELANNLYHMGIFHPDDMSSIILTCYQRKLKGQKIELDEQLKYYQDFWRESGVPVDSILEVLKKNEPK